MTSDPQDAAKTPREELASVVDFVVEQARAAKALFDDETRDEVTAQVSGLAANAASVASSAFTSLAAAAQTASAALDGWVASQRTEASDPAGTSSDGSADTPTTSTPELPAESRPTDEDTAWH